VKSCLALGKGGRDLGEVLQPRRALGQIPLKPSQSCSLVLRRSALGVEMDKLERVLKRQVRQLAGGVLGHSQGTSLDRAAEVHVRVGLGGHERMFPRRLICGYEVLPELRGLPQVSCSTENSWPGRRASRTSR
jgi:hypothetical protein